jgi:hypothetical protein
MPVLLALGWSASTLIGVDVDQQFTVRRERRNRLHAA